MGTRYTLHKQGIQLITTDAEKRLSAGKRPLLVEVVTDADLRSIEQNKTIYRLYREVTKVREDHTPERVRMISKLHVGVPLMRHESDKFREGWDKQVMNVYSYEQKLSMMGSPFDFPVTSVMNTMQLSMYMERLVAYWAEQGVYLELPNEVPLTAYGEVA